MKNRSIRVQHKAPRKKGKVEVRKFKNLDDAVAYLKRNEGRLSGKTVADQIAEKLRQVQ